MYYKGKANNQIKRSMISFKCLSSIKLFLYQELFLCQIISYFHLNSFYIIECLYK